MLIVLILVASATFQLVVGAHQECSDLDGLYGTLEQHSFRRINNWLTARFQFHHIDNLQQVSRVFEELSELLDDSNKNLILHLSSHNRERYKNAESMVNALAKIGQLASLDRSNICDNSSYLILLTNDAATGYKIHQNEDEYLSLGPVERVILYFCRLRASECYDLYPQRYRRKITEINDDIVVPLKEFVQKIMKLRLVDTSSTKLDLNNLVALTRLETSPHELQVVLEELRSRAASDEERISLEAMKHEPSDEVHRAAILINVKKMLLSHSGCEYYLDQLGESVFEQARYDLLFRKDDEKVEKQEDADYYQAWIIYGICKSLLHRADYVASGIMELASFNNNKLIT